jgi:hypothetical protein
VPVDRRRPVMRSIVFNLRPEVGREEHASLLTRVGRVPGIHRAAALSPNSKNATVGRMFYAYVNDDADIEAVRDRIARLPEVESADLPAERRLVQGGGDAARGTF